MELTEEEQKVLIKKGYFHINMVEDNLHMMFMKIKASRKKKRRDEYYAKSNGQRIEVQSSTEAMECRN